MTIKEFFSFKQNKFFWINLIAMVIVVALVLFGVLKGLDIYTRHGEAVVVPNVKGMGVAEGRLSSESKLQIRAMLREVTEIESIGDSCYNLARTINRKRQTNQDFTEKQYEHIQDRKSVV